MHTRLRNVTVIQKTPLKPSAKMRWISALRCARSSNPPTPPNTEKRTKKPTARNAASLTSDSAATAKIKPSWCSVASMWRGGGKEGGGAPRTGGGEGGGGVGGGGWRGGAPR